VIRVNCSIWWIRVWHIIAVEPRIELPAGKLVALRANLKSLLLYATRDVRARRVFVEEIRTAASGTP
jgi:hypothetical protein